MSALPGALFPIAFDGLRLLNTPNNKLRRNFANVDLVSAASIHTLTYVDVPRVDLDKRSVASDILGNPRISMDDIKSVAVCARFSKADALVRIVRGPRDACLYPAHAVENYTCLFSYCVCLDFGKHS